MQRSHGEFTRTARTQQDIVVPESIEVLRALRERRQLRHLRKVKAWDANRVVHNEPVSDRDVKQAFKQAKAAWDAVLRGGDPEIAEIWENVFRDRLQRWINQ